MSAVYVFGLTFPFFVQIQAAFGLKKKSLETSKWVFYWLCIAASLQVCFYCSSAYDAKDLMIFLEKSSMGERT